MKKTFILLLIASLCSGVSFASFQVKKSQKDAGTSTIAVENSQNDMNSASVTQINGVSENVEVSIEKTANTKDANKTKGDDGTIAIVLAVVSVLFLPFGLHNWYLGRTKQALWQTLLVVPFGILILPAVASWLWQLIDLIRLLASGGTL